jgi:hypothetical protein
MKPVRRTDEQSTEWLQDGGWHAASGSSHHGVLHPDEYVDEGQLMELMEARLGVSLEEARAVLRRRGRFPRALRPVRDPVDAAIARIHADGGNLTQLARILRVNDSTIRRAAKRGQDRRAA